MNILYPSFKIALTIREKEILNFITAGFNSSQIADKLDISKYTVDNHRRNMLKKRKDRNREDQFGSKDNSSMNSFK